MRKVVTIKVLVLTASLSCDRRSLVNTGKGADCVEWCPLHVSPYGTPSSRSTASTALTDCCVVLSSHFLRSWWQAMLWIQVSERASLCSIRLVKLAIIFADWLRLNPLVGVFVFYCIKCQKSDKGSSPVSVSWFVCLSAKNWEKKISFLLLKPANLSDWNMKQIHILGVALLIIKNNCQFIFCQVEQLFIECILYMDRISGDNVCISYSIMILQLWGLTFCRKWVEQYFMLVYDEYWNF